MSPISQSGPGCAGRSPKQLESGPGRFYRSGGAVAPFYHPKKRIEVQKNPCQMRIREEKGSQLPALCHQWWHDIPSQHGMAGTKVWSRTTMATHPPRATEMSLRHGLWGGACSHQERVRPTPSSAAPTPTALQQSSGWLQGGATASDSVTSLSDHSIMTDSLCGSNFAL